VTFEPGKRLDPSQVEDVRGRGGMLRGGGPVIAGGGGVGLLILLVASLLFGVDPGEVLGPALQMPPETNVQRATQECQTGADAQRRTDCRVVAFVNSVQAYWDGEFARRGVTYQPAKTVIFSGYVQAECGVASSAQGPFYCPLDRRIYLDTSFFEEMLARLGAQGSFAEGYVIAHEYGHHVQNILGLLEATGSTGPSSASVTQELMADCLAGVWARHAASTGYLRPPSDAEIKQALDAAAAVGDDRIQRATQGRVQPESWTHGSSEQRQRAFHAGYRSGDLGACGAG
jgi:predicted metalloprotease